MVAGIYTARCIKSEDLVWYIVGAVGLSDKLFGCPFLYMFILLCWAGEIDYGHWLGQDRYRRLSWVWEGYGYIRPVDSLIAGTREGETEENYNLRE